MSNTLITTLEKSIQRRKNLTRLQRGLSGLSLGCFLFLCFMIFDSLWSIIGFQFFAEPLEIVSLPAWTRMIILGLSLITLIWMLLRWRLPLNLRRRSLLQEANDYEKAQSITGNRLSNAVDFHLQHQPSSTAMKDPFAQQLTERVMHRADELAPTLNRKQLIPRQPVQRQLMLLTLVFFLYLIPMLTLPDMSFTAFQRWITPWRVIAPVSLFPPEAMISDITPQEGDYIMVTSDQHAKWHQARMVFTEEDHPIKAMKAQSTSATSHSDGRMKVEASPGIGYFSWQDKIHDQPIRFFVISHGTWDGPYTITPRRLPRIQGLTVEIKTGDQWHQMPYPTSKRYRADAGSLIRVTAHSNRADAKIDLPDSKTLSYTTYIKPGPHRLKVRLATPDELKSPQQIELSLFGRTPDGMTSAQEPEIDDSTEETTSRRIVDQENAKEGEKAEDMAKENQGKMSQMAERTGKGRALDAMERLKQMNDEAAHTDQLDSTELTVELAVGSTTESSLINPNSTQGSQLNSSQKAPEKYRALVQSYIELTQKDLPSTEEQP